MKKLILLICLFAAVAGAQDTRQETPRQILQYVPQRRSSVDDALFEKRYQPLTVNNILFWMDTTSGDLWRFGREEMKWIFIGSPRGANTRRKGNYQLKELAGGELIVLDTDSGEAWWTDGREWIDIDDPSTRVRKK